MNFLGEISALVTALSFSFTATFFTFAGRRVGAAVVNRSRLLLAMVLLTGVHWLFYGAPAPVGAAPERWLWLGLSGVVGLALGDAFLFQAFLWIGPRLSMLLMSLAPVLATLLAWMFLGETLRFSQIVGIGITIAGIAWVILEQNGNLPASRVAVPRNPLPVKNPEFVPGLLFGIGAAAGQALGLILAKKGLGGDFPALSGNVIRMLAAGASIWGYTLLRGQARDTFRALGAQPRALGWITGGAVFGPLIGVSFSLLAIQHTAVGIASTLMALTPVFLLPIGYFIVKERFGWQAVAGTLVAIAGVGVLFLA